MADRYHGGPRAPHGGISKSSASSSSHAATAGSSSRTTGGAAGSAGGSGSGSAMSSVRRNLFQSQLTRRPTSGAPGSASSSSNGAGGGATPSSSSVSLASSVGGDALRLDSAELQLGPEMVGGGGLSVGGAAGYLDIVIRDKNGEIELGDPPTPGADEEDDGMAEARHESEKERQRLVDAVKQHQIDKNSLPVQPEELLEAVRVSLRAKVAALADDNWMFEREELPRHQ